MRHPPRNFINYMRYVRFMNGTTTILLDEKRTKIKILDLVQLCNFYVHDFLAEIIYPIKGLFQAIIF